MVAYLAVPSIDGVHMDGGVINVQLHLASAELNHKLNHSTLNPQP